MKKGEKAGEIMAGRKREISQVADDQNWRSYVSNELKCAEIWNQDWGFLSQGQGKSLLNNRDSNASAFPFAVSKADE